MPTTTPRKQHPPTGNAGAAVRQHPSPRTHGLHAAGGGAGGGARGNKKSGAAAAAAEAAAQAAPALARVMADYQGRSVLVVFAVNKYPNAQAELGDLQFAVADGRRLCKTLSGLDPQPDANGDADALHAERCRDGACQSPGAQPSAHALASGSTGYGRALQAANFCLALATDSR